MKTGNALAMKRLFTSRRVSIGVDVISGTKRGKTWARKRAEWPELCAVADIDFAAKTSIGQLTALLVDFGYQTDEVVRLFGREANNSVPITPSEIAGFLDGAKMVHAKAKAFADDREAWETARWAQQRKRNRQKSKRTNLV